MVYYAPVCMLVGLNPGTLNRAGVSAVTVQISSISNSDRSRVDCDLCARENHRPGSVTEAVSSPGWIINVTV
jgi:hypothetical protein